MDRQALDERRRSVTIQRDPKLSWLLDLQEADFLRIAARSDPDERMELAEYLRWELRSSKDDGSNREVEKVEKIISILIAAAEVFDVSSRAHALLEACDYFDRVGNSFKGLQTIESVLSLIETSQVDTFLKRRIHNIAATSYTRVYAYNLACYHFDIALDIAVTSGDTTAQFAVLANIGTMYQNMGLIEDAKLLGERLLEFPVGAPILDLLHFQNAINSFLLCHSTNDQAGMVDFHQRATELLHTPGLGSVWKASYDSNHTLYLTEQGRLPEAIDFIRSRIANNEAIDNPRVAVHLFTAEALCSLRSGDRSQILRSRRRLRGLLKRTLEVPCHHVQTLQALVSLYGQASSDKDRKVGLCYAHRLREHAIFVKHKDYFASLLRRLSDSEERDATLTNPTYNILDLKPRHLAGQAGPIALSGRVAPSTNDELDRIVQTVGCLSDRKKETERRTRHYDVAENWAIAAEYSADRNGRHCFQVGRLAARIAEELGWQQDRCLDLELASRLHDIGKVAIDSAALSALGARHMSEYWLLREHTLAGARILSASNDPVLQLAADIACHHHEYWNGCGYPDGLRGDAISFEARICAVANTFLDLTSPSESGVCWSRDAAIRQILTMAGVQLDPGLMEAFERVAAQLIPLDYRPMRSDELALSRNITLPPSSSIVPSSGHPLISS